MSTRRTHHVIRDRRRELAERTRREEPRHVVVDGVRYRLVGEVELGYEPRGRAPTPREMAERGRYAPPSRIDDPWLSGLDYTGRRLLPEATRVNHGPRRVYPTAS